jgi:flagellin FlaB
MSEEYQLRKRDGEAGSIGIGAMIVFIALILVAAVASTIIIKTAEELQQNAESTSDDTRKEISGKINVLQILVNGTTTADAIDSLIVTAKVASGSMNVQVEDIDWVITCGGTTYGLITGNLGDTDPAGGVIDAPESINADYMDGSDYDATDELPAGTTFKFDINLDDDTADPNVADGGACKDAGTAGETMEMKIIVDGGGTTILDLKIDSIASGKEVT